MPAIGMMSYLSAAVVFLLLGLGVLIFWRKRLHAWSLLLPVLASLAWALVAAYQLQAQAPAPLLLLTLELVRDWAWLFFVLQMLHMAGSGNPLIRRLGQWSLALPIGLLLLLVIVSLFQQSALPHWLVFDVRLLGHVFIALTGLVLIEQVWRNAPPQEHWGIKFFCLGVGGLFAYDFYLFSDALLFRQIDPNIWLGRGFINAVLALLLMLAIARIPPTKTSVMFSRSLVFYSTGLMIAGGYLLIVALAGYVMGSTGHPWGMVLRHVLVFVALLVLLVLIFSGQMRARLRVFIDKHLLDYRYDYREEWLGLIRELSLQDSPLSLQARALRALLELVDSPTGALWVRREEQFQVVETLSMSELEGLRETADGSLARFLETWQWVINLEEFDAEPELYRELSLPAWLSGLEQAWLVVPLMLQNRLYGFVIVGKPRAPREFNWEDIDLLKTAGRQIAIHLAQQQAAMALAESRQFEAFNRFSAYVVHDLKNLVSQLALVVQNARKHRHNPEFMDDAIATVDNAVARMNRLLAQLRGGGPAGPGKDRRRVELAGVLRSVCREKANGRPLPELEDAASGLWVEADADRLVSIIGHVVQNAQDATPDHGRVTLRLRREGAMARIEVEDTGCGMDETFIKERLFRPFDTTKGLTGMGIGAHEVRAFIEELGGRVDIDSEPGRGTVFGMSLPLCEGGDEATTRG